MTCFSIQKYLHIFALALIITAGPVIAQDSETPTNEGVRKSNQTSNVIEDGESNSPIVIELFTTADCSACIFADKLLYESMKDKNVIGLSCYIQDMEPPKDPSQAEIAQPSADSKSMDPCAFRQWSYMTGKTAGDTEIRVPAFIVNGQDHINTIDNEYYATVIKSSRGPNNTTLRTMIQWKDGDTLTVHLPQIADDFKPNASVWLIRYKDMIVEKVDTGMNKGRVLRFSNVIQDIRHIAKWRGEMRSVDVDVPKPTGGKEQGGYVVLAGEMMGSSILAAGKIADYPVAEEKSASKP